MATTTGSTFVGHAQSAFEARRICMASSQRLASAPPPWTTTGTFPASHRRHVLERRPWTSVLPPILMSVGLFVMCGSRR
jgi:hypothetical protein